MAEEGQPDGCFPRVNGGMIQSAPEVYGGKIISVVGKVVGPDTIQTSDGSVVTVITDQLPEGTLIVNPDLVVSYVFLHVVVR
jgi:hypothetical protein